MNQIELYIDEDAMDSDLVAALRSRGVTVTTAFDDGVAGKSDNGPLAIDFTRSGSRLGKNTLWFTPRMSTRPDLAQRTRLP